MMRRTGNPVPTGARGAEMSIEASAYRNTRFDALIPMPVPPSVYGDGVSMLRNVGVIRNTGLELSLKTLFHSFERERPDRVAEICDFLACRSGPEVRQAWRVIHALFDDANS